MGALSRNQINEAFLLYENETYGFLYQQVPAVRTCVDFIARQIMQLDLELYGYNSDGEREDIDDHPAAALIDSPNSITPGKAWLQGMVCDYLIYANAYSLKIRAGNTFRIYQIPAHKVAPIGESIFEVEQYKIFGERGSYEYVDPEDVIHIKDYNPTDQRRGFSKLETLRLVLQEDRTMTQTNIELMKNGMTGYGNGWVTVPADVELEDEDRERIQAMLNAGFKQSADGTLFFPMLEDGAQITQPNLSPQKAQMLEQRKFSLETVAKLYGIPLGLLDGSVGDVEAQTANLYQDVLPPLCDAFQGFLNLQILEAEFPGEELCYEFDLKSKLRGDNQARLQQLVSVSGGPILTRNEARKLEGLAPLDDPEADELITPLNITVGGKPSPQVMPVQDPNGPLQDGSHRDPTTPPEVEAPEPVKALPMQTKTSEVEAKALLLARRKNQDRRRNEYASKWEVLLNKHFSRQASAMASKDATSNAADSDRYNEELGADILALERQQIKHEGDVAATRLGLPGFNMEYVAHYTEQAAADKAKSINGKTQEDLDAAETPADRAGVFDVAKSERAVNLGMTFATKLSSFAHREAGQQDPNVSQRQKTWVVTSQNSRHPELDGERVPLYQEFSNGCQMPGDGGDEDETAGCQCLVEVG